MTSAQPSCRNSPSSGQHRQPPPPLFFFLNGMCWNVRSFRGGESKPEFQLVTSLQTQHTYYILGLQHLILNKTIWHQWAPVHHALICICVHRTPAQRQSHLLEQTAERSNVCALGPSSPCWYGSFLEATSTLHCTAIAAFPFDHCRNCSTGIGR